MSSLSVDTDTNICGAFIVRQCGKQFCIQYLIWFSQLLSNIHATIVPHFVEQETEARWGEVTSPKSPSWASSWARIPARSEQPWDQYPVFSMEAFWTTPSERIADLLDNLDNHDLQDNLPFTTSLLGLFLCSPLRSFSTQISDLQPIHHTRRVSDWETNPTVLFSCLLQSLPGHWRHSYPPHVHCLAPLAASLDSTREGQLSGTPLR